MFAHGVRSLALIAGLVHLGRVRAMRNSSPSRSSSNADTSGSTTPQATQGGDVDLKEMAWAAGAKRTKLNSRPSRLDDDASLSARSCQSWSVNWSAIHVAQPAFDREVCRVVDYFRNLAIPKTRGQRGVWYYKTAHPNDTEYNQKNIKRGPVTIRWLMDTINPTDQDWIKPEYYSYSGISFWKHKAFYTDNRKPKFRLYNQSHPKAASSGVTDPARAVPPRLRDMLLDNEKLNDVLIRKIVLELKPDYAGAFDKNVLEHYCQNIENTEELLQAFSKHKCLNVKFHNGTPGWLVHENKYGVKRNVYYDKNLNVYRIDVD